MKIKKYEDLEIWRLSLQIIKKVYKITLNSNFRKDFILRDQIRKSAISINSNITEGFERNNNNEFLYFLKISKGSTGELRTQLFIALEINYITLETYNEIELDLIKLSKMIGKLISYLKIKRNQKEFINK